MKVLYTILFFTDTLVLIILAYLFFQFMDTGGSPATLVVLFIAIVICIFMLVYFLLQYIKIPSSENRREF
jgi:hypothetical protein